MQPPKKSNTFPIEINKLILNMLLKPNYCNRIKELYKHLRNDKDSAIH